MSRLPVISSDERRSIIDRARTIRSEMSSVQVNVASGSLTLADALSSKDSESAVNRLYVVKLLESLPDVGKVHARRVMSEIGIAERCRVADLQQSQRTLLIAKLGR